MADLGRWFKLWCSSLRDPSLDNLSVADFGRWAKLGTIIKEQGTDGKISFQSPARSVCASLQVESFSELFQCVSKFPNVHVSSETNLDVSFTIEYSNWRKYQGDFSTDRVHKFREKNNSVKRPKRRREEKRSSTSLRSTSTTTLLHPPPSGFADWPPEWGPVRKLIEEHPFLTVHRDWLCDLAWWQAEDERLSGSPKPLNELLASAVAYCITKGYKPTSRVGLRSKLHNCMGFEAERSQREAQRKSVTGGR